MPRYRRLPLELDAFQFGTEPMPSWFVVALRQDMAELLDTETPHPRARLRTSNGTVLAKKGDWILKDVAGTIYPCAEAVFRRSYEPALDDAKDLTTRLSMLLTLEAVYGLLAPSVAVFPGRADHQALLGRMRDTIAQFHHEDPQVVQDRFSTGTAGPHQDGSRPQ
jgi:hypothetical protein